MPQILRISMVELADLCRKHGPDFNVSGCTGPDLLPLDPAKALWAIAGKESSFGLNMKPRFEPAYFVGGRYYQKSQDVRNWIKAYGTLGASSFGPWQILSVNAQPFTPPDLLNDMDACATATVKFLNRFVITDRHAMDLEEIARTWNSGSPYGTTFDPKYVPEVFGYYNAPMPAPEAAL
jgi:hypothetical protein